MENKKKILIIGGTGSLGKSLVKHFLHDYNISVFSRDEAKHVLIKSLYKVNSVIGDIRDSAAIQQAIFNIEPDIVINAAALKNVPEVEEVPMEGIKTSLIGTDNVNIAVNLLSRFTSKSIKVLTVSTDKACKPVNAYGMAKALQERLHIRSNSDRVICNAVRYGNVLESRGSLIPIVQDRFLNKLPVFLTHKEMTRFFLTLDASVELIKIALEDNKGGHIFVPKISSARIVDVIDVLREYYDRPQSDVLLTSIRPGEKLHETLISEEEAARCEIRNSTYVVHDILTSKTYTDLATNLSSNDSSVLLSRDQVRSLLLNNGIIND